MRSIESEPARFGTRKSLLFATILIGLFFLTVEGGLRLYVYVFRSPAEVWDLRAGTFDLRPGEHRRVGAEPVIVNSRGFLGEEFDDSPRPGTLRIVSVGDSCTFGGGSPGGHYPDLLAKRLNGAEPSFEVINAGIEGLNSDLALRRLRSKVLPLEPDLTTIYIGWNDLMKFAPAGQTESPRLAWVARVLDKLWTVKGLRKLLFYHLRPRLRPPLTGPASRTGRFSDYRPAVFEGNLREMVAAARSIGSEVVITTLPSVVSDDMTAEDLRRANVQFPYFSEAYAIGDFVDLIAAYNRTVRRVALLDEVMLVDLAREIDSRPDRRELFLDTMHANARGREIIADILARELRSSGLLERMDSTNRGGDRAASQDETS